MPTTSMFHGILVLMFYCAIGVIICRIFMSVIYVSRFSALIIACNSFADFDSDWDAILASSAI